MQALASHFIFWPIETLLDTIPPLFRPVNCIKIGRHACCTAEWPFWHNHFDVRKFKIYVHRTRQTQTIHFLRKPNQWRVKCFRYTTYSKGRKRRTETLCLITETWRLIYIKRFSAHIASRLTCAVWRLNFTIGRTSNAMTKRMRSWIIAHGHPLYDVSVVIQGVLVQNFRFL